MLWFIACFVDRLQLTRLQALSSPSGFPGLHKHCQCHIKTLQLPPLYTFPFTLAGTRLSQITPDIPLQPFHHACTLFFTVYIWPSFNSKPIISPPMLLLRLFHRFLLTVTVNSIGMFLTFAHIIILSSIISVLH